MDLPPIRFPSEADVSAAEAARFRALSDEKRVRALGDCFREYQFLRASSGRTAELDRFAQDGRGPVPARDPGVRCPSWRNN